MQILDTLQSTLEINRLWVQGRGRDSNVHRAALLRSNFLRHWSDAKERSRSFSMLVLPGPESMVAVLNPSTWSYEARPAKDNYAEGLEALTDAAYVDEFTLIDLRELRSVAGQKIDQYGPEAIRVIHGFDMLLVMSGSTAASELKHLQAR